MLRIGELAKALKTTTKTLRYYERIGLLLSVRRTGSGYRMYDEEAMRRAREVIGLRRLGLSIEEVHDLLHHDPGGTTRRLQLLGLLDEKLRDIDETLAILQGRRDDLAARNLSLFDTPRERMDSCICNALLVPCSCINTVDTEDSRPQIYQEYGKSA